MSRIIIAGGDEAGRGAVLGPIVISLISIKKGKESKLARIGVRDSKMLTERKRRFLYGEISAVAEDIKIYKIANNEINEAMKNKISINELEALNFAKLIDSMEGAPSRIFIDSPDVVSERFGIRISLFSKKPLLVKGVKYPKSKKIKNAIKIISEHKADARYPVVSCASIIAKVERDAEIQRIKDRLSIDVGSGYPSDRYTIDAIRENISNDALNQYMRSYWKTLKMIRQLKINDFVQ